MRFQGSIYKAVQVFTLILAGLIVCGLLIITSVCLAAGDEWTKKADMPTERGWLSGSMMLGRLYAIGGWVGVPFIGQPLQTVEEYDPVRNKWSKKADMPTARANLSCSLVDGKIYAIGGWIGGAGWETLLSATEEYDPVADTWTKKADMPTARGMLSTSVVAGKIYAIGGYDGQRISTIEEYDPVTDTWLKKADMPTARGWMGTSVVNNRIYAIGGYDDLKDIPLKVVEEYDPATDTWTKRTDMPTARLGLTTDIVNGKIYAIGGTESYGNFKSSLSKVEIYDPVLDKWEVGLDMPTARAWLSSGTNDGKIYAIGGVTTDFDNLAVVEEYKPEGWPFAVSSQDKLATTWGKIKRGR